LKPISSGLESEEDLDVRFECYETWAYLIAQLDSHSSVFGTVRETNMNE